MQLLMVALGAVTLLMLVIQYVSYDRDMKK